ncbi:TonB-dependent receptor domain-containing protein [Sphingobium yanoikuyae]|uniref:TonB-dependent receptor domain-containing protein n=1 Tax=Sphingobium yanoikuyae TaxID=13690 RepID=UPI002FD9994F
MKTFSKRALLRASAAPAILGASLIATAAFAQEAPQGAEAEATDTIVVTGSLIKNPNLERSTPVTATTADQIELKQSNTAESILREIPGVVPSIGSAVNNGNGGASFVDLRGLGNNRNIVLLNGVRLTPADLQGRFDLNNVPVALIERVDVLTGGASTTYGADAISGVVNFITKTDFSGVEGTVSNQLTEDGDGNYFRADVTVGGNFDDGRGNAVFSVGYQQADPVYQGARGFSVNQVDSFTGGAGGSGTSVPSRFSGVNPLGTDTITEGCGETGLPACSVTQGTRQVNGSGNAWRPTSAYDAFNFNPYNIFQTPFERFNMFGQARYEISDAVEVYTRGVFSKNTVKTIIAPSGSFGVAVTVPLSNPYLTDALRNGFCQFDTNPGVGYTPRFSAAECAAAATATDPNDPNYREVTTQLSRRATEVGPRISEFKTTYFDYSAGFRGGITDSISWDVFGSYGESENVQSQTGYTFNSRVVDSLYATSTTSCLPGTMDGCVPANFFGPEGSLTSEMTDFLTAGRTASTVSTVTSMAQVRGTIAGDFGWAVPTASDPISFAVGGEYRKYKASQVSDLLSQSGDLGGAGGAAPNIAGGYDVYEAYGELVVPLVQDKPFIQSLTFEGGLRYSSYTVDAPGKPGFNTTTWKAGGTWEPVDGFKIRGNYAHAVRAPNIYELFNPLTTGLTNLATDPCASLDDEGNVIAAAPTGAIRDVCIAQIVAGGASAAQAAGLLGTIGVPTAGQANATFGGSIDMKPETSNSWTLGFVAQPAALRGFSATLDYYNIDIKNAITSPTPGDAIHACFDNPSTTNEACTVIVRNPLTGQLSGDPNDTPGLSLPTTNQGKLRARGFDLSLNYSHDIGFAKLALSFVGNYAMDQKFQAIPGSVFRECVGYYSVNCASIQPKFQWSQRTTLGFEHFDVSLLWRHIDGVKQEPLDADTSDPFASGPAYSGPVAALGGKEYNFGKIKSYDYFDLTGRFIVSENVTVTMTVQNMFDRKPPIVGNTIGATSFNSGNTYPSTYDALGRRYAVAAKFNF